MLDVLSFAIGLVIIGTILTVSVLVEVEATHVDKKEQISLQDQPVQNQDLFIHQLFELTA